MYKEHIDTCKDQDSSIGFYKEVIFYLHREGIPEHIIIKFFPSLEKFKELVRQTYKEYAGEFNNRIYESNDTVWGYFDNLIIDFMIEEGAEW